MLSYLTIKIDQPFSRYLEIERQQTHWDAYKVLRFYTKANLSIYFMQTRQNKN